MDLTATFLDYAGLPRPQEMDSRSLKPLLEGKTRLHRQYVLSGLGAWRLVWDGRYKLIQGFALERPGQARQGARDLPPLLFDLESDPLENVNLAAKVKGEVERLSKRLL